MTTWTCQIPLPPQWLSPNLIIATVGMRQARADAESRYKALCAPIFAKCPIRGAKFIRVYTTWMCVNDPNLKAKPNAKGKVTVKARLDQPYYVRDFCNAWGAFKYACDAIVHAGLIEDDGANYMSGKDCEIWQTARCRKAGITQPHIVVCLEIEEDLTL